MRNDWIPFEAGQTIGQLGFEDGIILQDECIRDVARVTLEEGGDNAPYSISMGVSYLLLHTHFCLTIEDARKYYQLFKTKIEELLAIDPKDFEKCHQKINELININ